LIKTSENYIAIPPGETLKDILYDKFISGRRFAELMDMSLEDAEKLLEGDIIITLKIATNLERIFSVPATFWTNLEGIYQKDLQKVHEENSTMESW
jgi:hypothetical protein